MRGDVSPDLEVFRPIPGFTGYEVSNWGRPRSFRNTQGGFDGSPHVLKPIRFANGYRMIAVRNESGRRKMIGVHRLVLLTFVGEPLPGQVAAHFPNPDRSNNRLDNLRWAFHWKNELDKPLQGSRQKRLTRDQILEIRDLEKTELSQTQTAKCYGVDQAAISRIRRGKSWEHVVA